MENGTGLVVQDAVNCSQGIPSSKEMVLLYMSQPWSQALMITMVIISILSCLMYVETALSIMKTMHYGERRGYTIFILGLVPVHSLTSLASIFIPKAAILGSWAASLYMAVSLYIFLMLIFNYFGGPDEMVVKLATTTISLAQPPLACCFPCCCRKIRLTMPHLHRLRAAVLQLAVVQPMTLFVTAILWADGLYNPTQIDAQSAFIYLTALVLVSTLTAMYALTIINVAANASLAAMYGNFRLKFSLLKAFMIIPSVQSLVISIISQSISLPCKGVLSPSIRSTLLYNYLIIVEVFFILFLGRCKVFFSRIDQPLHQAEQPDSLNRSQTNHRYAEVRDLASPLLDKDGKRPSFPTNLLDIEKANEANGKWIVEQQSQQPQRESEV
ncbi:organic solute transporter subunit alpha-like [Asterias amurensis]|uniref:organic solute transporter subunit alpha-like n=1 Tax=Asterias amurensis TaxID=7602 RepID=UPI003AB85CEB